MASGKTSASLQQIRASDGWEAILRAFRDDGAVIIKGLISSDKVDQINAEIQPAMDKIATGSRMAGDWLKEFHGHQTKRLTNMITHSKTFREVLLDNDLIHQLCEGIFREETGSYWMNSAQVIEIGPGSRAQEIHRDQRQYPVFTAAGPNAPEAVVNFMVAMTDFTVENGATRITPGSHKWDDMAYDGSPEETVPAEMSPGDACLMSGKVVHGGGANTTKDFQRRGLAITYQPSYLTPEEAYPFLVKKDIVAKLSKRAQSAIGFRTQFVNGSPGLWKCDYGDSDDTLHTPRWEKDAN
ncbi:putative phytanoyl- dioxygenase protein [Purpureocillium lavendulum]|uniref:Phytanoyl- dioxygenase protein n=1 Tax=Purpureocillium lavendulum TaxID=1247861 RepID=A0AB34FZM1_9HYPO|nr:putative phytanoyl- dioxygenase protein [Purpureocillium lavendulum]